jgi:hypothetical protein
MSATEEPLVALAMQYTADRGIDTAKQSEIEACLDAQLGPQTTKRVMSTTMKHFHSGKYNSQTYLKAASYFTKMAELAHLKANMQLKRIKYRDQVVGMLYDKKKAEAAPALAAVAAVAAVATAAPTAALQASSIASERTDDWYKVALDVLDVETEKLEAAVEDADHEGTYKDVDVIYKSVLKRLGVQERDAEGHIAAANFLTHVTLYTQLVGDRLVLCLKKEDNELSAHLAPIVEAAVAAKAPEGKATAKRLAEDDDAGGVCKEQKCGGM